MSQFYTHSGGRPPLKTVAEMAESLGLTARVLSGYLRYNDGPAPALKVAAKSIGIQRTYYDPRPVRAWWRTLLETRPDLVVKHGF